MDLKTVRLLFRAFLRVNSSNVCFGIWIRASSHVDEEFMQRFVVINGQLPCFVRSIVYQTEANSKLPFSCYTQLPEEVRSKDDATLAAR